LLEGYIQEPRSDTCEKVGRIMTMYRLRAEEQHYAAGVVHSVLERMKWQNSQFWEFLIINSGK
jgi:hypothetical protein